MKSTKFPEIFIVIFTILSINLYAQDKVATIQLKFEKGDSINTCSAFITSQDSPVKDINVKLYVQRSFSLLPIGDASSDEEGIVNFEFPKNLPGDKNGNLTVIAKIEDDENYENTESKSEINWGIRKAENGKLNRSISASKAPIYFIVISNMIIFGIWGTLIYVVLQIFKLKKVSDRTDKRMPI